METKTEKKETLSIKLGIDEQRSIFLIKKCQELMSSNKFKDTVDVMWEMRNNFTKNAAEDMLVCYSIGSLSVLMSNPISMLGALIKNL